MSEIASESKSEIKSEKESTPEKRAYNVTDLKKEQLSKARARALELRNMLNAIKPPKIKSIRLKQPSKLELEIAKIKEQTGSTESEQEKLAEPEPEKIIEPEPEKIIEPEKKPPIKSFRPPQKKQLGFQRDKQSGFFIL